MAAESQSKRLFAVLRCFLSLLVFGTLQSKAGREGPGGGLQGSLHTADTRNLLGSAPASNSSQPWMELLSWKPRTWLYHNFLSQEECDHLVDLAKPAMHRSTVVDRNTGANIDDPNRTSYGAFLSRYQDDVVRNIEDRIAAWTHIPVDHGEALQVLKYAQGQKYDEHQDYFGDEERRHLQDKTNRIATVLMYLSDVEEGGETRFRLGKWIDKEKQQQKEPSACAQNALFTVPIKGDALLFWDLMPDGQHGDKHTLHAGCPVIRGQKWSATKWVHNAKYGDGSDIAQRAYQLGECLDLHDSCKEWAAAGKCHSTVDRKYMVGDVDHDGHCYQACRVCEACPPGDILCYRKNQRRIKEVKNGGAVPA